MTVELQIANEKDLWNQIVESSPHGTIFHTWNWLKIVEKHSGAKLFPLVGYRGSTPVGVYPVFRLKKKIFRMVFSPPPRTLLLYLGPAIANYDRLKQNKKASLFWRFQREVDEFISSELKANYTRIRTSPGLESRPLMWGGYDVRPLYTCMIRLDRDLDDIWSQLHRKTRVNIEKTKREGVTVQISDKEGLEYLRTALHERFKEQGFRSEKDYYREYLNDLYDSFYPENMKIFVAKYKEEMIGGFVLLCYGDWTGLWIGIPKTRLSGIYPNDLAQWEAIKWARERGHKIYEIMDSGDDPRLTDYKSKFNPEPIPWFSAVKYSSPYIRMTEGIAKFFRIKR